MASAQAIKAGEAVVSLGADDKEFNTKMDRVAARMSKLGGTLRRLGGIGVGVGAALAAPLAAAFKSAAEHADKIQKLSERLGSDTEATSRLTFAADFSDVTPEQLLAANKKLQASAVAAAKGAEEQSEAFAKLGISAADFLKLPVDERFATLARAIEGVDDPVEKSRLQLALLGKSAADLAPLIGAGEDALRDLFRQAEETGNVIKAEDGKNAAAALDAITKMTKFLKAVVLDVGLAVMDTFNAVKGVIDAALGDSVGSVREFIKANRAVIGIVAGVAVGLMVVGFAAAAVGVAVSGLASVVTVMALAWKGAVVAVGLFKVALLALATPWGIVGLAIGAAVVAVLKFTGAGQRMMASLGDLFGRLADVAKTTFGAIVGFIKKGDLGMAWAAAMKGLQAGWLLVLEKFKDGWRNFANFFEDAFRDAMLAIREFGIRIFYGIAGAFVSSIKWALDKINALHAKLPGNKTAEEAHADLVASPTFKQLAAEESAAANVREKLLREKLPVEKRVAEREGKIANTGDVDLQLKLIGEQKADQAVLADLEKQFAATDAAWRALEGRKQKLIDEARKAAVLIDPEPAKRALEQIEKDTEAAVRLNKALDDNARNARNAKQQEEINGIIRERVKLMEELRQLKGWAEAPDPMAVLSAAAGPVLGWNGGATGGTAGAAGGWGLPVAPMPRELTAEQRFGQAVRGLYQSADFRGSLGIGPANSPEVGELKGIKKEMADGNTKMDEQTSVLRDILREGIGVYFT